MTASQLDLRIVDTPFDPDSTEKVVRYRQSDGRQLYKIWLYVEGRDLPFVKSVKYMLHPSFRQQEHFVERTFSNPNCRLRLYTWGIFEVKAIVEAKGEAYELRRQLQYDQRFSEAKYSLPE